MDAETLQSFDVGTHVVIELEGMDVVKIAGYLHGVNDDGIFIRATNKDIPVEYSVSDAMRGNVAAQLDGYTGLALKLELARRGYPGGFLLGRKSCISVLTEEICEEMVEKSRELKPYTWHEYALPVLTYIGMFKVGLMQASSDIIRDVDVITSGAQIDAELDVFLDGGIPPREGARVLDDEEPEGVTEEENEQEINE